MVIEGNRKKCTLADKRIFASLRDRSEAAAASKKSFIHPECLDYNHSGNRVLQKLQHSQRVGTSLWRSSNMHLLI